MLALDEQTWVLTLSLVPAAGGGRTAPLSLWVVPLPMGTAAAVPSNAGLESGGWLDMQKQPHPMALRGGGSCKK